MQKKVPYKVKLRRKDTGEEYDRLIFALDETNAGERAIARAKSGLIGVSMAERQYAQFDVLSVARS